MKCENCQAEVSPNTTVCPECGAPLPQKIEGFENAITIQKILKAIVTASGPGIYVNNNRFIALINDCLADFEKERRLLVNMINAGILRGMVEENDHKIAILRAKSTMQTDCFIIENAAEFVVACFTYILGWTYDSSLRVSNPAEKEKKEKEKAEKKAKKEAKKEKAASINPEEKVFRPRDAFRFRLVRHVSIPEGFTKIEGFCFDRFSAMRAVELPSTLLSIGEYAFSECKHLMSCELPESVRIIQTGAFSQCMNLVSIKIPEGVLEIAENTFLCCSSLETVEVPATVTSIGANAFSGCESLRKLFLHDSVKFIDEDTFTQCTALTISCMENSYVHKYCLSHNLKFETVAEGADM